ncbi:hypothetical protein IVG45_14590 [Methylomonas sp. LL1]|uniref:hypothetical protein n=1 Tax=Methylomonas sp. LL1 TaxID=2785785 RepID=UPI0018C39E94|nr:hypothetical protein [Methylomonas sp. LL1]QPK62082.1 hypothetical protein IVG45_14590 [Methylomonas sp. LL1]
MKKVHKNVYCSRCGDEISADELKLLSGTTCALCSHMQHESLQIRRHKLDVLKHVFTVIQPGMVNQR